MESLAKTNADKKRELELMQSQFKEIESQAKLSRKTVAQKQAAKNSVKAEIQKLQEAMSSKKE